MAQSTQKTSHIRTVMFTLVIFGCCLKWTAANEVVTGRIYQNEKPLKYPKETKINS